MFVHGGAPLFMVGDTFEGSLELSRGESERFASRAFYTLVQFYS